MCCLISFIWFDWFVGLVYCCVGWGLDGLCICVCIYACCSLGLFFLLIELLFGLVIGYCGMMVWWEFGSLWSGLLRLGGYGCWW